MMKMWIVVGLTAFFTKVIWAQDRQDNVIVKYKQYESFDLGSLEIKGEIIAPGDLSVKERERKQFRRPLFERYNFDPEVVEDIKSLR